MKQGTKFFGVALISAFLAFFFGPILWPTPFEMQVELQMMQMVFVVGISAVEAMAFGYGFAFLLFGWPSIRSVFGNRLRAKAVFISIVWLLLSWWPHDNFHRVNGDDINGLLVITYVFHVSLIVAGVVLVEACRSLFRKSKT